MKHKQRKQIHAIFLSIIILLGLRLPVFVSQCGLIEYEVNDVPALNDWINRPLIFASPEEVECMVSQMQYIPSEETLPFDALEMKMNFNKPLFITRSDAREDVERLFYLLENGYAGYGYFNEGQRFQEAKESIIQEIDKKPLMRSSGLSSLLYDHLGFLHDCHLTIGDHEYESHLDFWYDAEFEFRKQNKAYVFTHDGVIYSVISINSESPDSYMFPSINSDGENVYRMGVLSPSSPPPLDLRAESNQETRQWEFELRNSQPEYSEIYMEKRLGGVPIVRIRSFSDQHKEYINEFLACADKYRDEPCLIVDIRGNGGGNTAYARQWITRYAGQQPSSPQIFTELISETSMMGRSNYFAYMLHYYPELEAQGYHLKAEDCRSYADEIENDETSSHWSAYNIPSPKKINNNSTLIVLIDKNVGSAAEGFLSYLQQVENVVFVGENSAGALTYGQMSYHMLPHSRLIVRLPISLNVFVDLKYREEKGFYPDLWVQSGYALNYAVAAVRMGSIPTSSSYREEILGVDFVPEKPSENIVVTDYFPILFGLFYGVILVFFNRQRKSKLFLIGGVLGALLGTYYLSRKPDLGYALLLVGFEYLVITFFKWRKEKSQ